MSCAFDGFHTALVPESMIMEMLPENLFRLLQWMMGLVN